MALAKIALEPEKGGRGKPSKILEGFEGGDSKAMREAIYKARLVLHVTPAVADRVLAGTLAPRRRLRYRDSRKKALVSIAFQLQSRGLTQEQIAAEIGVPQQTLSRWLTQSAPSAEWVDTDPLPDKATLDRIARAIKDDASYSRLQVDDEVEQLLVAKQSAPPAPQRQPAGDDRRRAGEP